MDCCWREPIINSNDQPYTALLFIKIKSENYDAIINFALLLRIIRPQKMQDKRLRLGSNRMTCNTLFLSLLGATSANLGVSSDTQANSANVYQQSIANAFQQSAQNSLGQQTSIQPTLHINQGDAVTVFVTNDIDLYAVLHSNRHNADEDNSDNPRSAPSPSPSAPHTDGVVFP